MFGQKRKLIDENRRLKMALERAIAANEEMQNRAFIVGIEREGRINKFIFARRNSLHQIETMGLISDDLPGWKKALL